MKKTYLALIPLAACLILGSCRSTPGTNHDDHEESQYLWPDVDLGDRPLSKPQDFVDVAVTVSAIGMVITRRAASSPLSQHEGTQNYLYLIRRYGFEEYLILCNKIKILEEIVDMTWTYSDNFVTRVISPYMSSQVNYDRFNINYAGTYDAENDRSLDVPHTLVVTANYKGATAKFTYSVVTSSFYS